MIIISINHVFLTVGGRHISLSCYRNGLPWELKICLQYRRPQFNSWVRKSPWKKNTLPTPVFLGFPGGSDNKESACNVEELGSVPGWIPWRRARQPTPVVLPGESPWTEEPGGLQSMVSLRVGHDWVTKHSTAQSSSCLEKVYVFHKCIVNPQIIHIYVHHHLRTFD